MEKAVGDVFSFTGAFASVELNQRWRYVLFISLVKILVWFHINKLVLKAKVEGGKNRVILTQNKSQAMLGIQLVIILILDCL